MNEDTLWNIFAVTGCVEDYLRYSALRDKKNDNGRGNRSAHYYKRRVPLSRDLHTLLSHSFDDETQQDDHTGISIAVDSHHSQG